MNQIKNIIRIFNNNQDNSINLLDCQNILITQTAFLGDTALSLHLVQFIKDFFEKNGRNCKIYFLTIPAWKDLVENIQCIDEVIYLDKKNSHHSFYGLFKFAKSLNRKFYSENIKIDCVISLHKSQRTSILHSFIESKFKVGFDNSKLRFVYDRLIKYNSDIHEVDRYFSLMSAFNEFHTKNPNDTFIFPKLSELEPIRFKFDNQTEHNILSKFNLIENNNIKNYICIAPGSVWATKKWKTEYFAKLTNIILLNQDNLKSLDNISICIVGGKNDLETNVELKKYLNEIESIKLSVNRIINLVGETNLLENQIILKNSKFTITNDSSPTHLSELVHTNVLTIYGPTSPKFGFAPKLKNSDFIELNGLSCKPCHIHGKNTCPIKTHNCMVDLTPEMVYKKFVDLYCKSIARLDKD